MFLINLHLTRKLACKSISVKLNNSYVCDANEVDWVPVGTYLNFSNEFKYQDNVTFMYQ